MAKKSAAPLVVPLVAAAGVGAFLFTRKAKAGDVTPKVRPKKKKKKKIKPKVTPKVTPKKKKKDTGGIRPEVHPIIGRPYKTGKANEAKNAKLVCSRQPLKHPRGMKRRASQRLDDWYANVAFWETYRQAPTKLSGSAPEQKTYRQAWVRIRKLVRKCLTTPKKKEKVKPTTPKKGAAFPDRAAEIRNAQAVAEQKPQTYRKNPPPHNSRRSGQELSSWLANVAYWVTYPDAPVKLTGSAVHRKYATAWKRIKGLVDIDLLKLKKKKDAKDKGTPSKDVGPSTEEPPIGKPAPGSAAGAAEMRNAAIVAVDAPTTYSKNAAPYNVWKGSNRRQKLNDWLANVAYWATYPTGPVVLKSSDKKYVAAWLRIRKQIDQAQAAAKGAGDKSSIPGLPSVVWKKYAAALSLSSNVRSGASIKVNTAKAFDYLKGAGKAIPRRDIGDALPTGGAVTLSGLMAEATAYADAGKLVGLSRWRPRPTRAFWVVNGLF